ncbi:MAG: AraC family transcriptional regulator [Lentisphaeria bacterium]
MAQLPEPESYFAGRPPEHRPLVPTNLVMFWRSPRGTAPFEYRRWMHHRHMLVVCLTGRCRFVLDEWQEYQMTAGDAVVVKPYQMHHLYDFSPMYDLLFVKFDLMDTPDMEGPSGVIGLQRSHRHELEQVIDAYQSTPPRINAATLRLGVLLDEIAGSGAPRPPTVNRNQLTDQVVHYICNHLNQPLSIASLAAIFGYSGGHLQRLFKAAGLRKIGTFIRTTRFQKAESLLHSGDLEIKEILHNCGFRSFSTFSREFRRQHGRSPREFRAYLRETGQPTRPHPSQRRSRQASPTT